jgi:hypothetical protein
MRHPLPLLILLFVTLALSGCNRSDPTANRAISNARTIELNLCLSTATSGDSATATCDGGVIVIELD